MIKKLVFLTLLLSLTVGFSSCSSDDEPSAKDIVGKWICVDAWYVDIDGEISDEGIGVDGCYVFHNDGTGYYADKEDLENEVNGSSFTYTFKDNILRMVGEAGDDGWQIGGGSDESGHIIEIYHIKWLNNNKFEATYPYKDNSYDVEVYERF